MESGTRLRFVAGAMLSVCAALAACSSTPEQPEQIELGPFPEAEYAKLPKSGTATITGQAFMQTRGGTVIRGAGSPVLATPATTYGADCVLAIVKKQKPHADPRLGPFWHRATADADGSFHFDNLPPGPYMVLSFVSWEAPIGRGEFTEAQGGWVFGVVKAENGKSAEVMLTR